MQVAAKPLARTQKSLTREMQVLSTRLLQEETIRHFEVLSLDMANNCLNALYHMGGVSKEKRWVTISTKTGQGVGGGWGLQREKLGHSRNRWVEGGAKEKRWVTAETGGGGGAKRKGGSQ